jgi:uncharacterized RDD family membrane protein YckC
MEASIPIAIERTKHYRLGWFFQDSFGRPRFYRLNATGRRNTSRGTSILDTHRNVLYAAPTIVAGILWSSMMLYFLIYYETLPRGHDGNLPRIGDAYSTFPYISCIGAIRMPYFQGFAIAVATLVSTGFLLDYHLGRLLPPGRWFRRSKLFFSLISCVFLIALSFESVNNNNHLHLIFTSIQIWCMGSAKLSDYFLSYCLRRKDRLNPYLCRAKLWKKCIGLVAFREWTTNA